MLRFLLCKSFYSCLGIIAILGLLSTSALAFIDAPPPYKIRPILHGLNIHHFVKQDRAKTKLYLLNKEKFTVLCDAEYHGGPDHRNAREQYVEPGEAVIFKFSYGRAVKDFTLTYMCVNPDTYQKEDKQAEDKENKSDEELL